MNLLLTIKTYSGVNIVGSIVLYLNSLSVRFFIEQNGGAIIISYVLIYFACLQ